MTATMTKEMPLTLRARTAADLMTPNPISVRDKGLVADAVTLLTRKGFHAAPVIDESGRPVGVLSYTDVLVHERARRGAGSAGFDEARVRDLMTPAVFSVPVDAPAGRVVGDMVALNVHQMYVVDAANVLVGVVTALDVLRHLGPLEVPASHVRRANAAAPSIETIFSRRTNMKNFPFIATAALLLLGIPVMNSHGDEKSALQKLMTKKLECSQKVLQGLAVNDYDLVAKNAEELIQVSKAAEFRVLKTPQYEVNSNDFRRAAETMIQQAKAKNTDGIALAYVDMTLSCVRCHKHVREVRMASLDVDH